MINLSNQKLIELLLNDIIRNLKITMKEKKEKHGKIDNEYSVIEISKYAYQIQIAEKIKEEIKKLYLIE